MAKNITQYSIFVASPGDVVNERNAISNVINELSGMLLKVDNIALNLVKWETNVYPNIGEDVQDVINTQTEDDYDIFIGIMWSRIGTKTSRAESGTIEEFERAYTQYISKKNRIKILFYFKIQPISPKEIDVIQLGKVNEFKNKLSDKGVLYGEFYNTDDFKEMLRGHLFNAIADLKKEAKPTRSSETNDSIIQNETVETVESQYSDIGIFELLDEAVANLNKSTSSTMKIVQYQNELNDNMTTKTEHLTIANSMGNVALQRQIIDEVSSDMINYCDRIDVEIPILINYFKVGFDQINTYIFKKKMFGILSDEEKEILNKSIVELVETIFNTTKTLRSFLNTSNTLADMTTSIIKAKKRLNVTVTVHILELEKIVNLGKNLLVTL